MTYILYYSVNIRSTGRSLARIYAPLPSFSPFFLFFSLFPSFSSLRESYRFAESWHFLHEAPLQANKQRGRTRCSASCLAHKLKRPHQPRTDRKFSLVGIFALLVHPSSTGSREKEFPAHLVLAFGSSDPRLTLFLCLPPNRPQLRRKPCAKTVDHIHRSSVTDPNRSLQFLHRDSLLFFASKKGCTLHIPSSCSALCLGVLVPWFSNPNQQRAPPKQDSHSEREAFSYHTYFISGKNNKLHILDAQQSSQGKRIQSIKLPTAPTPKRLFSFRSGHNKHKSRHKSRIGSLTTTQHK